MSAIDGVLFVCFLLHCLSSVVECGCFFSVGVSLCSECD